MRVKRLISFMATIVFILSMFGCSEEKPGGLAEIEYSENVNSIAFYFDKLQPIERVYFKSEQIGDGRLGPSSFRLVGFICISADKTHSISNSFDFKEKEPDFPEGISSNVTGKDNFSWQTSADFTKELLEGNFVGEVYLDFDNNMIYIDIERT